MLRILRQLTPDEMRRAAMHCNARPGATPEEIIRSLARASGASTWGLFPVSTDEALLDHVGRRLGMEPYTGGPRGVSGRERAIFACYLRQAWAAAEPERRWTLLSLALSAWDSSVLPRPDLPEGPYAHGACQEVLESLLQHGTGCRVLSVATEGAPLPLPALDGPAGPRLPFGYGPGGHQALYAVLRVLWCARARLLREKRTQRLQLERQARQVESLLVVRRRNLTASPSGWALNPASGLSLAAAAGVSAGVHLALAAATPFALVPAAVVGVAGLAWSASALSCRQAGNQDGRMAQMQAQLHSFRQQVTQIEREVFELESE